MNLNVPQQQSRVRDKEITSIVKTSANFCVHWGIHTMKNVAPLFAVNWITFHLGLDGQIIAELFQIDAVVKNIQLILCTVRTSVERATLRSVAARRGL